MDEKKLEKFMEVMQESMGGLQKQMNDLQIVVANLTVQVENVKAEVENVKAEVENVKAEVADVKLEVANVKEKVREDVLELRHEMNRRFASVENTIKEREKHIIAVINENMDAMYHMHKEKTDDHEMRIVDLENAVFAEN